MKITVLAVLATLTLSMAGVRVQAQTATSTQQGSHAPIQQGNDYNFMLGGGG